MIPRRTFMGLFAVALAASSLAACASQTYTVSGTVSYRERLILPADAVVVARLEDITKGQTYPVVISEQRISPNSAGPTRFALPYVYGEVNPQANYVVTAWVEQGGRVLFRNAKLYQVITKGSPTSNVNVELEQVAAQFVPAPAAGTSTTTTSTTTTTTGAPPGTVIVQPAPQQPGTYVVQPAPATAPPGSVILNPAR